MLSIRMFIIREYHFTERRYKMRLINCTQCGGGDFFQNNGYLICKYCNSRYAIGQDDMGYRQSSISLGSDVDVLLRKARMDPRNAKKYANLVLDIDPDNEEANFILRNNR